MTDTDGGALDSTVLRTVYAHFVATGRPPSAAEIATALAISTDEALVPFRRLHERHALFLEPGKDTIRMAHPFSGVPTAFNVRANGQDYWANCAWDALGIAGALHADAEIVATYAEVAARLTLSVEHGEVGGPTAVVHLQVPFRRWYDDLVET